MYRRGIEQLDPLPAAVGIVTSPEVFEEYFGDSDLYVLVAPHPPEDYTERVVEIIAQNREVLNEWFLNERTETFIWWIDSDIEILQPDGFTILAEEILSKHCMLFSNGYQGRGRDESHKWHGIGCTIVHRDVAGIGKFCYGRYTTDDGKEGTGLSEDLMYFAPYEFGAWVIQRLKPSYTMVRDYGDLVEVKHHLVEPSKEDPPFTRPDRGINDPTVSPNMMQAKGIDPPFQQPRSMKNRRK